MARINVFAEYGQELEGWFDDEKARCFEEKTNWDGRNLISCATGSQWRHEELYRTAGGRWVLHHWSQVQGEGGSYHFITDDEAKVWLLKQEHDSAVEEFFELEDEMGPGRPEIGPTISIRLTPDLLEEVDANAESAKVSRAEAIRRLLRIALHGHELTTAG